jgi:hypothetical protein
MRDIKFINNSVKDGKIMSEPKSEKFLKCIIYVLIRLPENIFPV